MAPSSANITVLFCRCPAYTSFAHLNYHSLMCLAVPAYSASTAPTISHQPTQLASLLVGGLCLTTAAALTLAWASWRRQRTGCIRPAQPEGVCQGVVGAIGNTPLIRIASLSDATGCEILGKAEMLNPGGSVKDRVALQIVTEAMAEGRLLPGGLITEGTAGSTGVSLAMVAAAVGCHCFIAMPDDAAIEKVQ
ncbi:PALP domain-containing protein, partial [Haematococcus lacustris]